MNCCASSGPRAVALLPTFVYSLDPDGGIRVNIYTRSELSLEDKKVRVVQETDYPYDGVVKLRFLLPQPKEFPLRLRIPEWCEGAEITVNSEVGRQTGKGYWELNRRWEDGDTVQLKLQVKLQVIAGRHTNEGKLALVFGPLVLAVDERFLPDHIRPLEEITVDQTKMRNLPLKILAASDPLWEGEKVFETEGELLTNPQNKFNLRLTDFAHAGAKGTRFLVWIPKPQVGSK